MEAASLFIFCFFTFKQNTEEQKREKTLVVQLNHQELKKLLFVVGERMRERIREKERRLVHSRAWWERERFFFSFFYSNSISCVSDSLVEEREWSCFFDQQQLLLLELQLAAFEGLLGLYKKWQGKKRRAKQILWEHEFFLFMLQVEKIVLRWTFHLYFSPWYIKAQCLTKKTVWFPLKVEIFGLWEIRLKLSEKAQVLFS